MPSDFHEGAWRGEPAFIVGGGPSVKCHDIKRVQGRGRIIAINRALELPITPDIWLFVDHNLWAWAMDRRLPGLRAAIQQYSGLKITRYVENEDGIYPDDVTRIKWGSGTSIGPSLKQGADWANNSGFWAVNIAYLLGADPIVLIGFDCDNRGMEPHEDAGHWFHDGYPSPVNAGTYNTYVMHFERMAKELEAKGVRVWNCSPLTALTCWEVVPTLDEVFERVEYVH